MSGSHTAAMKKSALILALAAASFATAQTSTTGQTAATTQYLKLAASTEKVTTVTVNGKATEKLVDAAGTTLPGDTLQLTQQVRNISQVNVRSVTLNMPVPAAATFQSARCSAEGRTLFSVDGKAFGPAPLKKTVTVTENGKSVTRQVDVKPSEYRAVRWQLPDLAAGKTNTCFIRVQVR